MFANGVGYLFQSLDEVVKYMFVWGFFHTKCVCPNPSVNLGNPMVTLIVSHYLQSKNHI